MPSPLPRYYSRPVRLPSLLFLLWLLAGPTLADSPALVVRHGDLPLLIVAGHGGKGSLDGAEIRLKDAVNDPHFVLFGDIRTNELATDLAGAVSQEFANEHKPSLILNKIHRRFADVNRSPELTSHHPVGVAHHAAFHQAIGEEVERLVNQHGWVLLLDIHGQSKYNTTLLLGTAENSVVAPWSVDTLWGAGGLVSSLLQARFTVEPATPEGKQRYGGGYTVRHHGKDPRVEAWQMEHSLALRDDQVERARYLEVVARVLADAIKTPPR